MIFYSQTDGIMLYLKLRKNGGSFLMKPVEYEEVRCPSCKEVVLTHTKIDYLYGSPIRECPFCKAEVVDPYFHEIAIDGLRKDPRKKKKMIKDIIICAVLTVILGYFNLVSIAMESSSVIMFMLMFFAFSMIPLKIWSYFSDQHKMKDHYYRQIRESKERLADKAYAKKLADLGYNVPQEYL